MRIKLDFHSFLSEERRNKSDDKTQYLIFDHIQTKYHFFNTLMQGQYEKIHREERNLVISIPRDRDTRRSCVYLTYACARNCDGSIFGVPSKSIITPFPRNYR